VLALLMGGIYEMISGGMIYKDNKNRFRHSKFVGEGDIHIRTDSRVIS
jgi:hypothetical protein